MNTVAHGRELNTARRDRAVKGAGPVSIVARAPQHIAGDCPAWCTVADCTGEHWWDVDNVPATGDLQLIDGQCEVPVVGVAIESDTEEPAPNVTITVRRGEDCGQEAHLTHLEAAEVADAVGAAVRALDAGTPLGWRRSAHARRVLAPDWQLATAHFVKVERPEKAGLQVCGYGDHDNATVYVDEGSSAAVPALTLDEARALRDALDQVIEAFSA